MLKIKPCDIPFIIATVIAFALTIRMLFFQPSRTTVAANVLLFIGIAVIWLIYVKMEGNVSNTQVIGAGDLMLSILLYTKLRITIVQMEKRKTKKHNAGT